MYMRLNRENCSSEDPKKIIASCKFHLLLVAVYMETWG